MDAEYGFNCAVENGFITPLEASILFTHPNCTALVESFFGIPRSSFTSTGSYTANWRHNTSSSTITDYHGNALVTSTSPLRRFTLQELSETALAVFNASNDAYKRLAVTIARGNYNDVVRNMVSRLVQISCNCVGGYVLVDGYLFDSSGAKRLGKRHPQIAEVTNRLKEQQTIMQDVGVITTDELQHYENELQLYEKLIALNNQSKAMMGWQCTPDLSVQDVTFREKVLAQRLHQIAKMGKRAIKRAYKFYEKQNQTDMLRVFISGGALEFTHPSSPYKFVIERNDGLLAASVRGGGGWRHQNLSVYTKSDVYLTDLCVYFRDTPVLDQLMSFKLMIEAGLEEMLLEKANVKTVNTKADIESLVPDSCVLKKKLLERKEVMHALDLVEYQTTPDRVRTRFTDAMVNPKAIRAKARVAKYKRLMTDFIEANIQYLDELDATVLKILRDGRAFKELARVSLAQPPTKSFTLLLSV